MELLLSSRFRNPISAEGPNYSSEHFLSPIFCHVMGWFVLMTSVRNCRMRKLLQSESFHISPLYFGLYFNGSCIRLTTENPKHRAQAISPPSSASLFFITRTTATKPCSLSIRSDAFPEMLRHSHCVPACPMLGFPNPTRSGRTLGTRHVNPFPDTPFLSHITSLSAVY